MKPWESPKGWGLQLRPHLQNEGRGHCCSQVLPSGSPREPTEQHTGLALAPPSPRRTAPEAGLGPVTALPAPDRPTHPAWCWEAPGPPAFPLSLLLVLASSPPTTAPPRPPGFGTQGLLALFWTSGSGWETLSLVKCLLGWHPQAWPWPSRLVPLADHLSGVHLPFPPPPGRCPVSSFLIRQNSTPHNLAASFPGRSWGSGPAWEPGGSTWAPRDQDSQGLCRPQLCTSCLGSLPASVKGRFIGPACQAPCFCKFSGFVAICGSPLD